MIRSYNYDSLQSIEDSTFLPFIGRKLSDQEVIDMFRGSSFYDESMTYQVKFNYQAASKWQPFFVILLLNILVLRLSVLPGLCFRVLSFRRRVGSVLWAIMVPEVVMET